MNLPTSQTPDTITKDGVKYTCQPHMSAAMRMNNTKKSFILKELAKQGRKAMFVKSRRNGLNHAQTFIYTT